MRLSVGTDIIEISRIKNLIDNTNFIKKMYTNQEIEYCESKKEQKYQSYAARFAAKEAIYKALSNEIPKDYSWKDFEIINSIKGKPEVYLHLNVNSLKSIEISISHCKEYAVAYVTAILEEN